MDYLFKAYYNDGSSYTQNIEDKSILEPEKRSCFFDVDQSKLIRFDLFNNDSIYSVNLLNGIISANIKGSLIDIVIPENKLSNFRIIYFRRKQLIMNPLSPSERSEPKIIKYILGWQANDENNKNIQQIVEINI